MNFLQLLKINRFVSRANQCRVRPSSSQLHKLDKESYTNYSHNVRTHCPRLNLYRSEWTQLLFHKRLYFNGRNSCLRSSLAARNLETVENFAQLKELFVLVFSGETLTSDATADAL